MKPTTELAGILASQLPLGNDVGVIKRYFDPNCHFTSNREKRAQTYFFIFTILGATLFAQNEKRCIELEGVYFMETDAERWEGNMWAGRRGPFPFVVRQCADQYSAYMNLEKFFAPYPPLSSGYTMIGNNVYSYIVTSAKDSAVPKRVAIGSLTDSVFNDKSPLPMQALYLSLHPDLLKNFGEIVPKWRLLERINHRVEPGTAFSYSISQHDGEIIHEVVARVTELPALTWVICRLTVLEITPGITQRILLEIRDYYPPINTSYTDIKYEFETKSVRSISEIATNVIDEKDNADLVYIIDTRKSLGIKKATYTLKTTDQIPFSASAPAVLSAVKNAMVD